MRKKMERKKIEIRTIESLIFEEQKAHFGAFNRVHRYDWANLIFFWLLVSLYLVLIVAQFWTETFTHSTRFLFSLSITTGYCVFLMKWTVPRFCARAMRSLNIRHPHLVAKSWGEIVEALDLVDLKKILKRFNCLREERIVLLVGQFEQLSRGSRLFTSSSPAPFNGWIAAIIGGVISSSLFDILKMANELEFQFIFPVMFALFGLAALVLFIQNSLSRQYSRIAELLRKIAIQTAW